MKIDGGSIEMPLADAEPIDEHLRSVTRQTMLGRDVSNEHGRLPVRKRVLLKSLVRCADQLAGSGHEAQLMLDLGRRGEWELSPETRGMMQ